MRVSLVVEADYDDLTDQDALKQENLAANLRLLAQRIETDYKERNSEQNKYGVFYQIYQLSAGAAPGKLRGDSVSQEILNQLELEGFIDPKITPIPKGDK